MVFLPLLQCTFHTTAVLTTPKAHVCSGEQQHCLFSLGKEDNRRDQEEKADTFLSDPAVNPQNRWRYIYLAMQGTALFLNPTCTEQCVVQFSIGELEIILSSDISQLMTCLKEQGKCPQAGNLWSYDRRGECLPKRQLASVSFSTMAKITAQDFGTMKKQTPVLMQLSSTKQIIFKKKISHYSATKWQVVSPSQKKAETYFWCLAAVLVKYSLSWVENEFSSSSLLFLGPNRMEEPWIHKQSQAEELLFRHPLSSDTSMPLVYQKTPSFLPAPKKTESATQMLSSLTFLPSPGLHHWRNVQAAYAKQHYVQMKLVL